MSKQKHCSNSVLQAYCAPYIHYVFRSPGNPMDHEWMPLAPPVTDLNPRLCAAVKVVSIKKQCGQWVEPISLFPYKYQMGEDLRYDEPSMLIPL